MDESARKSPLDVRSKAFNRTFSRSMVSGRYQRRPVMIVVPDRPRLADRSWMEEFDDCRTGFCMAIRAQRLGSDRVQGLSSLRRRHGLSRLRAWRRCLPRLLTVCHVRLVDGVLMPRWTGHRSSKMQRENQQLSQAGSLSLWKQEGESHATTPGPRHVSNDHPERTNVRGTHLLSAEELAEFLGVPLSTIYQWRYLGQGPRGMRVGRHLRFATADVDAWLEKRAR